MAETKTPGDKTLSVTSSKSTLSLKPRTETGMVRQSFSHGRSKQVVVERSRNGGRSATPSRNRRRSHPHRRPYGKARGAIQPAAAGARRVGSPRTVSRARAASRPASCCEP